jgi:branched-chain amino acid transport system permease protein
VTLLNQWLQDWLPRLFGHAGNFEIIVFGMLAAHPAPCPRGHVAGAAAPAAGEGEPKVVVDAAALPRRTMPARAR